MSKTGSGNGSFFGNFIYDQLFQRRPHFLSGLYRAVDFSFVKVALKDFYVAVRCWPGVLKLHRGEISGF